MNIQPQWTAFKAQNLFASGHADEVGLKVRASLQEDSGQPILIFDNATGRVVDIEVRTDNALPAKPLEELYQSIPGASPERPKQAGRPKLGVVAREVTLLPRHWEWLAAQPSGASATLRKLVEAARKQEGTQSMVRQAQATADCFMTAMLGNEAGYEEASRALYAGHQQNFLAITEEWPTDLRDYARQLALPAFTHNTSAVLSNE